MSEFKGGVFLIDKPAGLSSFGIVRRVKKLLGIKKVGHAGTLDPFATGLLIVCGGRPATKMISSFMDGEKEYLATLYLGRRTTTLDPEGDIVDERDVPHLNEKEIEQCLSHFRGDLMQRPPSYSAVKYKGKPLYHYARKGITIEKEPRPVTIYELERCGERGAVGPIHPLLKLRVVCSKGTYIRTLADDIGTKLGCGAYLQELRRTRSGVFSVQQAIRGDDLLEPSEYERVMAGMMSVEDVQKLLQ
ncbi:tRNA pseudouridine(55) synthase TruB [Desulfopila sp. IMCC35008]|uniref:tRNA pseudouridine(55) synthase TruB n=1 Tax=Desulfopila sp. IMCC35008 TaxID=2653858 RepID=UPI0013D1302B|nr:tRNA pseudouridine(55) synthase TruB [Desulfopila sp. IMCC35008]